MTPKTCKGELLICLLVQKYQLITMRVFNSLFAFSNIKRVLLCPDKFKYSLTSAQIIESITKHLPTGIKATGIPLADGGEGSLEVISSKVPGQWLHKTAKDPLFRQIDSSYYTSEDGRGFVEMSRASGLALLTLEERQPMKATTYGTGQLIEDCLKRGLNEVNVLVGGSATNQGGIGCTNALGFDFLDRSGRKLEPTASNLAKIRKIQHRSPQLLSLIRQTNIRVLTDVLSPLLGANGCAAIYGPQKGATPEMIDRLQEGMANLRSVIQDQYGMDVDAVPGSGAAGGFPATAIPLLNASIQSGIDLMFRLTGFDAELERSDLVVTGEGRVDCQTFEGKVAKGVIDRASKKGKPVIVVCSYAESLPSRIEDHVRIVELLKPQERAEIVPSLTRSRLEEFTERILEYVPKFDPKQ